MTPTESLDQFLEQDLDDTLNSLVSQSEQIRPKFEINDIRTAEWAVKKVLKNQQTIDDAQQFAKGRIDEINAWLAKVEAEKQRAIDYLQELLRPYAEQQLTGSKTKTLKLPSGNISFRAKSSEFFIAGQKVDKDNEKLIAYVKSSASKFLVTKEHADWSGLKDKLTVTKSGQVIAADGEILEFITAVEYPDSISVKERKK